MSHPTNLQALHAQAVAHGHALHFADAMAEHFEIVERAAREGRALTTAEVMPMLAVCRAYRTVRREEEAADEMNAETEMDRASMRVP